MYRLGTSNSPQSPVPDVAGTPPEPAFHISWLDRDDGTRMVTLSGELDLAAREQLVFALGAPRVNVDMSGVTFIDSSALRCLVEAKEGADRFEFTPSAPVLRVIEVSGLEEFFGL